MRKVPDFLDEEGFELTTKFLGLKPALETFACQNALLRILDVMKLLALYQPFDPA